MTYPDRSPHICEQDPLEVARSARMMAFGDEIDARAELARIEILAEHHPRAYVDHVELAKREHAEKARNSQRWQRLLALIEEDALLNGGSDGD